MSAHFTCPVCGYPSLQEEPFYSYEICPCCGVEFGFDDEGFDKGTEPLRARHLALRLFGFRRALAGSLAPRDPSTGARRDSFLTRASMSPRRRNARDSSRASRPTSARLGSPRSRTAHRGVGTAAPSWRHEVHKAVIHDPRAAKPSAPRKAKIPADPPGESRRSGLWLGLSLVVAFFCLFQALPRWSRTDGLPSARNRHRIAPSSSTRTSPATIASAANPTQFFKIEDIRPNQLVLASNPATGQLEPRRVLQTFRRTTYHLRHLTFQSPTSARQTFETTDEHPFWSHGAARWTPAGDLQPGDRVIDPHGAQSLLVTTYREPHPEGVTVYNFEVEGFHSYFVAAKGPGGQPVLVHNADCGPNSPSRSRSRPANDEYRSNYDRIFGDAPRSQSLELPILNKDFVPVQRIPGPIPGEVALGSPLTAPHNAVVAICDASGNIRLVKQLTSSGSNQASFEGMLSGWKGRGMHTEARATTRLTLQPGETMVIAGDQFPCTSCKGFMNRAAAQTKGNIVYQWWENRQLKMWRANPKRGGG